MIMKHDDWLVKKLKDAEFAAEYLNAARDDDDSETYLRALQQVATLDEKAFCVKEQQHENGANED
jgi:DNA-binding phage protein